MDHSQRITRDKVHPRRSAPAPRPEVRHAVHSGRDGRAPVSLLFWLILIWTARPAHLIRIPAPSTPAGRAERRQARLSGPIMALKQRRPDASLVIDQEQDAQM